MTVETTRRLPIKERCIELHTKFQVENTEEPKHLYLGESEYGELALYLSRCPFSSAYLPAMEDYKQGSAVLFGLRIFLVGGASSHLAVA